MILVKTGLNDPDNHDGVNTHLESDILESEVKGALESITTNKAREVMEFQLSYFKSWKMMLWKCCTQYASNFGKSGKPSSGPQDWKTHMAQRRAKPQSAQMTAQSHSFHELARSCSISSNLGFNKNFPESKTSSCTSWIHRKTRKFQKNIYFFHWLH